MAVAYGHITLTVVYDGEPGATGQGISSITEEYYLSTSKTTQTGGSWVTTPPTWSTGKYIWTRSKIVWSNPTATTYTTPIVSAEWEAANYVTPFIVGTQTAATGAWKGVAPFEALTDGQQITYWLPYAGSGNATLELTLPDASTTGAIACYYSGASRLTTHYAAGNAIRLTYKVNASVSGTLYTGWWADANYDTNTYDRILYNRNIVCKSGSAITANYLIVADDTGYFYHLAKNVPFRVDMPLLFAGSSLASGASGSNNYTAYPSSVSLRLNSNEAGLSLTSPRMVYIKGSLSGRTFTPNATVLFTDAPTDDGSIYMLLGQLYSAYQITLITNHDLYMFDGGVLKSFAQIAVEAKADAAAVAANLSTFQSAVNSTLGDLQNQIDGSITTWFYAVAPTTSNVPASTWTTTDLKNAHLGDLYYDTQTGYAYRWQLASSTYSWARITDTDVTKALADAQAAQDTADSKRRVFTAQPAPPYDVGDLWTQGSTGDLMRCKTAKSTGSYSAGDWESATKYTDDSNVVTSSDVEYYLSTSSTTPTGGSWQTTAPAWVDGKFMFSRTKITYGSGTIVYTPSVNGTNITGAKGATGSPGADGADGADGKGIASQTTFYAVSTSATVAPTSGWQVTMPTWTSGQHLWLKIATEFTYGPSVESSPICASLPADSKTAIIPASCTTAVGTAAKVVTSSITPQVNDLLLVTYTYGNTANTTTIALNGGAAKPVKLNGRTVNGSTSSAGYVAPGSTQLYIVTDTEYSLTGSSVIADNDTWGWVNLNIPVDPNSIEGAAGDYISYALVGVTTNNTLEKISKSMSNAAGSRVFTGADRVVEGETVKGIRFPMDFTVYVSSSGGATGKNLLVFPYYDGNSKTTGGVTFTVNPDGSVHAAGTATSDATFYINNAAGFVIPAGTYTFSGCPSGGNADNGYFMRINYSGFVLTDIGEGATATRASVTSSTVPIYIRVRAGATVNHTFYPQLELGSTATAYEPYTSGIVWLRNTISTGSFYTYLQVPWSSMKYPIGEYFDASGELVTDGTAPTEGWQLFIGGLEDGGEFVPVEYSFCLRDEALIYKRIGVVYNSTGSIAIITEQPVFKCPNGEWMNYFTNQAKSIEDAQLGITALTNALEAQRLVAEADRDAAIAAAISAFAATQKETLDALNSKIEEYQTDMLAIEEALKNRLNGEVTERAMAVRPIFNDVTGDLLYIELGYVDEKNEFTQRQTPSGIDFLHLTEVISSYTVAGLSAPAAELKGDSQGVALTIGTPDTVAYDFINKFGGGLCIKPRSGGA